MNLNKTLNMGGATYETPTITTLEFQAEGVLCGSGDYFLGGGGIYDDDHTNDNGEY